MDRTQVTVPTMVLWGRNDEILDSKFAERFPKELPGSQLIFVDKCGHSPHLESASFVTEQVLGFVRGGKAVGVRDAVAAAH